MKYLLILLIIFIGISLILVLPIDFIQSIIPSWKTTKLSGLIRLGFIGIFNIGLPILFYMKLNKKVKPKIIVAYFLIINLLFTLQIIWPKNFVKNGNVDLNAYSNYAWMLAYIFIATLYVHLIFYIYFLIKLVKKGLC
jgi:apolipoprotein N-acyltransferase